MINFDSYNIQQNYTDESSNSVMNNIVVNIKLNQALILQNNNVNTLRRKKLMKIIIDI